MADPRLNIKPSVNQALYQRTLLLGRVKMAQAIKMPEAEWAKLLSEVEHDPLFQELLSAREEGRRIIKFKRFGSTSLSGQFYEGQDANVIGGGGQSPESLLDQKKHLWALIKKIGQENFEKYFLYREETGQVEEIAGKCGCSVPEARELMDFIMDMSVQSEFYHPSSLSSTDQVRPTVMGRIIRNEDGTYSIAFYSPHLARGLYDIDRNALRRWQKTKKLDRNKASQLKKYIGLLELSNLKEGAFWRVIDFILKSQKNYFDTEDRTKLAPVSLRKAATQLQFAPSTLSRVLSAKSILLPWGHEVRIIDLLPGQRRVLLTILEKMTEEGETKDTDIRIAQKIEKKYGMKVSRRTITTCRHFLLPREEAA